MTECTAQSFKWRNSAKAAGTWTDGSVTWTAKGVAGGAAKKN